MPSILNMPANKIPIHLFHLPITQREVLLVNILTNPILYKQIINSALYHDDPVFPAAITLFHNYSMSWSDNCVPTSPYHTYPCRLLRPLTLPCPLPELPLLSCWWTKDSTDSWPLSPVTTSPTFSTQFSSPSQRSSATLTTEVTRWRRRFHANL